MAEDMKKMAETVALQQAQIADFINVIKAMPGIQNPVAVNVQPAIVVPAVVRAEKVQRLAMSMRKSNHIKIFKFDSDIQIFIKKFGEELNTLKQMVGIDNDLTKDEYVPIFRASLDFAVLERVEQVFKKDAQNVKKWEDITIADLHKLMKDEFGAKHTDVASVLQQFGPSRLIKSSDKSVQDFYYEWSQNIPEVMKPNTEQEFKDFADLIHRAMYYISLDDTYLQQALTDLKTPKPDLKAYFDKTIAAESRRKCFQDIATSSSSLDSKGGSQSLNGMRLISIKRRKLSQILSQMLLGVLSLKKRRKSKIKIQIISQIKNQMKPNQMKPN